ncbi:MAG: hypothetical protein IJ880_10925 [Bacilli bacterium]|nr:hypothetical protein [Bacilli bacterium]
MLDKDRLKKFLLSHFPNAHTASNGREVVIRCPFCGDSQKDMRDAHFYIGLQTQNDDLEMNRQVPPVYHCFLCNRSGTLTGKVLLEMLNYNIDDEELIYELNVLSNNRKTRVHKNRFINKLSYTTIGCAEGTALDNDKLNYINSRLGLRLTMEQALKDKIVFNLLYFLYYNGINVVNVSNDELTAISQYFIGFLSLDNSFITFRNCSGKKMELNSLKKRYMKYQIQKDDNGDLVKYYCLPSKIDKLSVNPINIHVAEGPFDILSICYNLNHNNRDNQIYISAGGKGYFSAVRSIISYLKLSPNLIIHVYPDNDVDDSSIRMYANKFTDIGIQIYIHRNVFESENDFGVRLDRISDRCIKI